MPVTAPISLQIEQGVEDIPGWSPLDQLQMLFMLAYTTAELPGDILELGSWCGRSAVALGMASKLTGRGVVHCIDLFPEKNDWFVNEDGTYSFGVRVGDRVFSAYHEQTVWAEPFEQYIAPVYENGNGVLDVFHTSIERNELQDVVQPFKGDMELFSSSKGAGLKVRMAFIDGDHSYDAVTRDIEIVKSLLVPGGWICFDDAFSCYEGVDRAIKEHIIGCESFKQCQQLTRKLFVAKFTG